MVGAAVPFARRDHLRAVQPLGASHPFGRPPRGSGQRSLGGDDPSGILQMSVDWPSLNDWVFTLTSADPRYSGFCRAVNSNASPMPRSTVRTIQPGV